MTLTSINERARSAPRPRWSTGEPTQSRPERQARQQPGKVRCAPSASTFTQRRHTRLASEGLGEMSRYWPLTSIRTLASSSGNRSSRADRHRRRCVRWHRSQPSPGPAGRAGRADPAREQRHRPTLDVWRHTYGDLCNTRQTLGFVRLAGLSVSWHPN